MSRAEHPAAPAATHGEPRRPRAPHSGHLCEDDRDESLARLSLAPRVGNSNCTYS